MSIKFNNTYSQLPENFYIKINPVPVKAPYLIHFNYPLARELGIHLEDLSPKELAEIFSGNKILYGSKPMALIYAGHQFGNFVPQLGDGRAILLGEVKNNQEKQFDIQLKGSGLTPFSRSGDGRAALGPMLREYIVSEAMHALGIKTTRSLALVTTGEEVIRETIHPGAILTRIASSHIRIGTFEYFAARRDFKSIKILADYVIKRHYPQANYSSNPYKTLLENVRNAQAELVIDWMRVGFIHGVMNTDNMTLSGETIDYGPCAFMDEYSASKVFSSIDHYGRYAFNNQADICFWNLLQFGYSISSLLNSNSKKALDLVYDVISSFKEIYEQGYLKMMGQKIGIAYPRDSDKNLIASLLNIMEKDELDYTLTFRYLCYANSNVFWPFQKLFTPTEELNIWIEKWQIYLQEYGGITKEGLGLMFSLNPAFIPRNHKIEEIIQSINNDEQNYIFKMKEMISALSTPYTNQTDLIEYISPPTKAERVTRTFCGT